MSKSKACALTIAGSDSGGGAGIQADLKTFAAHGVHGLSAIAALTAQNTQGVQAIFIPPPKFLRAQLDSCFNDFNIGAVKIGMLANKAIIDIVADALEHYKPKFIVLDPVMVSSSGHTLLETKAIRRLTERLLPMATVITPNIDEAALLIGHAILDDEEAEAALVEILAMGAKAVLLKGGHLPGKKVIDRLDTGKALYEFEHPRLKLYGHGTGCTLSSAIAANLVLKKTLPDACELAGDYVFKALQSAYKPGKSELSVLNHIKVANIHGN
jgi:hydroxymethylpyrimidine/phosphomethylpyrimidine kinase